jgi:ubiquinol-cytochrome c reductase cytochrome c1 subunit
VRYNQLQKIGFNKEQIEKDLIFTGEDSGSMMTIAMTPADGEVWFGKAPPDLSLIARARASETYSGADWLYAYLRGFHKDEKRPTGWNNTVFPSVGMPHAMWDMQNSMSTSEYDGAVADLVSFLVWMGEPVAEKRKMIGIFVLIFLAGYYVLTHLLGKSYWKNIR